MATYKFGPGGLADFYAGGGFSALDRSPAFTGFPGAYFGEFNYVGIVGSFQPAIEAPILDVVRWVWQVKVWRVVFDAFFTAVVPSTQDFTSQAADEFGILDFPLWLNPDMNINFGQAVIFDNAGRVGFKTIIDGDITLDLDDAAGDTLTFSDGLGHQAIATEQTYWDWVP